MKFERFDMAPHIACAALRRRRGRLLAQLDRLRRSPDPAFAQSFPVLVAAVEAAFRHEEGLLDLLGEACLHPRLADHAIILCALHRTAARIEAGDLTLGRQVMASLDAILRLPPLTAAPATLAVHPLVRHARGRSAS
jgi:hypothetical protein